MAKRNFSSKRNAIYNAVCGTDTHPSARWVYDKLKPEIPDLSLGTVYRNIALFKDEGKVSVICNVNGEERIDGNTEPHPHFVCNFLLREVVLQVEGAGIVFLLLRSQICHFYRIKFTQSSSSRM